MHVRLLSAVALIAGATLTGCTGEVVAPTAKDRPSFITYGSPTGTEHPEVVLIVMDVNGAPAYRCSGTLISPSRVLTAGHCTGAPGEFTGMRILTESDVQHGNNNDPNAVASTLLGPAFG